MLLTGSDGSKLPDRLLYVDDVLATANAQEGLQGSWAGMILGSGKNITLASFFSGLIDDVWIYNRAVRP